MPVPARLRPAVLGALVLVLSAVGAVVTQPDVIEPSIGPPAADAVAGAPGSGARAGRPGQARAVSHRPLAAEHRWSGYAFDACRAPSQKVMDRWRHTSPFRGIGVYLGGIHRACPQKHLTPRWVRRQTRAGWRLLPLWVGPQASCTGYRWRIDGRPGPDGSHGRAARDGLREARAAVGAARRLGISTGSMLWYDIEPFPLSNPRCRRATLTFLDAWTRGVRRLGFRSGVYSHVAAGVSLLSRAPARYALPDAVWYAYVNHRADDGIPSRYVRGRSWMRSRRVHQFVLDQRVRFGGYSMHIDWNWVNLGSDPLRWRAAPCGATADRIRHPELVPGVRGRAVAAARCLLRTVGVPGIRAADVFDVHTKRAVAGFQRSRQLAPTGAINRRTWMALLAAGPRPVLKQGSAGPSVRRLQRSLNAALARDLRVHGGFDRRTVDAVRRYQAKVGQRSTGVVTGTTWRALSRGKLHKEPRPGKAARVRR